MIVAAGGSPAKQQTIKAATSQEEAPPMSCSAFRLWDRNAARSHMPVDGRDVLIKLVDSVFFVP